MKKSERGGAGRAFLATLVVLTILGLLGVVGYLMTDLNRRRYRFVVQEDQLVIQRGRSLPFGYEPFEPEVESLRAAYAPLRVPPGGDVGGESVFDDRSDMDRAIFALFAGWARQALESDDPLHLNQATMYIKRSELLPGLSEEQRVDLRTLHADLAYRNGRRRMDEARGLLAQALESFELAIKLGTSRPTDAAAWAHEVRRRKAMLDVPLPEVTIPTPNAASEGPAKAPLEPVAEPNSGESAAPEVKDGSEAQQQQPKKAENPASKWRL